MGNINFVRSVSPSYNALSHLLSGEGPSFTTTRGQGPLAGGTNILQTGATDFRPPTRVQEKTIFGGHKGWRDTSDQERSQYKQHWLGDRRNQGYGQGQVDPGLARAAISKEKSKDEKSGGK